MQKGVDAVAIGVIAFGIIALIALVLISNNMMPDPLPTVQQPQIESTRLLLQNPTAGGSMGAPAGAQGGFGAGPGSMGGGGMLGGGGFEGSSAAPPPAAGRRGRTGLSEDL